MYSRPFSEKVAQRLKGAAMSLRTADPTRYVGHLIEDTFPYPQGDRRYARNPRQPFAAPLSPVFGTAAPRSLAFDMEPLGPEASGGDRRDAASREMRRLVEGNFGRDALRWFDGASESFRGMGRTSALNYGAFFGSSFDGGGLETASVTYEGGGAGDVNPYLARLIASVVATMPGLRPVFTTVAAGRDFGSQRITFLLTTAVRLADFEPVLDELGLGDKLGQVLKILGLTLGGRFDLPPGATLVALGRTPAGPEMELHVMLDAVPDLPPNFLQLLTMNLRERPRELQALERFLAAFTPENDVWPGRFSILGLRIGPEMTVKASLHLRPIEFEVPPSALLSGADAPITA